MKEKIRISVVICTRNRLDYLKKCISSALQQSYLPKEIIIIDDASKDTLNVSDFFKNEFLALKYKLSKLVNSVDIILVKNRENSGVVSSRNTGIRVARGDVVAFLDDDGFAHKDWLKKIVQNYKEGIVGVGGPVVELVMNMKTPKKPVKRLAYVRKGKIVTNYRIKNLSEASYLPRKYVPFLQGGNMSFRKDALIDVKGGDVNLTGNSYREETDLSIRISKQGKLLFAPDAITYHNTAMTGGNRELINFNLDKFLFYMFRNTTYFFFKHFDFRKAVIFTYRALKSQIKLLQRNKTGLNRDFLKIVHKDNSIASVIVGALTGFYNWIKIRGRTLDLLHSEPAYMSYFKLLLIGGTVNIIELEKRTHVLKKLLGL